MTEEQAEDICITAMVEAHGGQTTNSKRFFKAMRVLNMRDARELYESLSEEFVRKGIASNRFSELTQLFTIAEASLVDYDDREKQLQSQLEQKDKRIKGLEGQVAIANNLILTAKKQFAPHTTNSDADAYIEKYLAKSK